MGSAGGALADSWRRLADLPSWYKSLTRVFRSYLVEGYMTDMVFHCKGDICLNAHSVVMANASVLCSLLMKSDPKVEMDDKIHFSLPDVDADLLETLIQAIYLCAVPKDQTAFVNCMTMAEYFGLFWTRGKEAEELSGDTEHAIEIDPTRANPIKRKMLSPSRPPVPNVVSVTPMKVAKSCCADSRCENCLRETEQLKLLSEMKVKKHQKLKVIMEQQCTICDVCTKPAIYHRKRDGALRNTAYVCCVPDCNVKKPCRTAKGFNNHMNSEHGSGKAGGKMVCPICYKPMSAHKNPDPTACQTQTIYKCCACTAARLRGHKFFLHTQGHILKPFSCPECGRGYASIELRDNHHYRAHGEGKNDLLNCKDAAYTAAKSHEGKRVRRRRIVKSGSQGKLVKCPKCKVTYKSTYYQLHHRKICFLVVSGNGESDGQELSYKCEICGMDGFEGKGTLTNHLKTKHQTELKYGCQHCGEKFTNASAVAYHRIRRHKLNSAGEPVEEQKVECHVCGKSVSNMTKLKLHISTIHEGVRPYACQYCSKRFSSNSNRKVHEGALHTGVHAYKCHLCSISFRRKQGFEAHTVQVHGLEMETPKVSKALKPKPTAKPPVIEAKPEEEQIYQVVYDPLNPATIPIVTTNYSQSPTINPHEILQQIPGSSTAFVPGSPHIITQQVTAAAPATFVVQTSHPQIVYEEEQRFY